MLLQKHSYVKNKTIFAMADLERIVFSLGQLTEKHCECNIPTIIAFNDYMKAFRKIPNLML